MRASGKAGAAEVLPPSRMDEIGEVEAMDTWLLNLWDEMHSRVAAGWGWQLLTLRADGVGLVSREQHLEVWERVAAVERVVWSFLARRAE